MAATVSPPTLQRWADLAAKGVVAIENIGTETFVRRYETRNVVETWKLSSFDEKNEQSVWQVHLANWSLDTN
jgi:hypothetical protein